MNSASRRLAVVVVVALGLLAPVAADTLLANHFGVNLSVSYIQDWEYAPGATYSGYQFDPGSFAPTINQATADYQVNDWFGAWDPADGWLADVDGRTYPVEPWASSTWPAGDEPYDTEAYYFDDDSENLYFVAVVGFPSPTDNGGIFTEDRLGGYPIVQGDFAIDIVGQGNGVTDAWGFQYDFGVDLTHEVDPGAGEDAWEMYDNDTGNQLYETTTGWYLGTPNGAVYPLPGDESGSFTNFDPVTSGLSAVGAVGVQWYEVPLLNTGGDSVLENNWQTYAIELTISRDLLPALDPYQQIRFQWLAGCRNDANTGQAYLDGDGITPEPGTAALMLLGIAPLGAWMRKRRTTKSA